MMMMMIATAAVTGGQVTVQGVGSDSVQGDAGFFKLMESMGCEVSQTAQSTTVKVHSR